MKLSHLQAFCLVANRGSLLRAAQMLKLTPAAISLQLKHLEEEVGVRLFERRPNKLLLTEKGKFFLSHAQRTLQSLEDGIALLRGEDNSCTGNIIVATTDDMAHFLAPRMTAFIRANPMVNLSILVKSSQESLNLVIEGQADIGIGRFLTLPQSVQKIPLSASGMAAVFPKDHPLAKSKHISIQDLASYGLILAPQNTTTRRTVEQAFAAKGVEMKTVLEASGCAVIREYVELRLGVGLVHEMCIRGKKWPLCVRQVKPLFGQIEVSLIHRKDRPIGPAYRKFIDAIS